MGQTPPRAAFEVIEPELFFQLLVRLLAGPSSFDRGGDVAQSGVCGVIGEVVFLLATCTTFAYKPDLAAWAVTMSENFRAICSAYTKRSKVSSQRVLGSLSPSNVFEVRLRRDEMLG